MRALWMWLAFGALCVALGGLVMADMKLLVFATVVAVVALIVKPVK